MLLQRLDISTRNYTRIKYRCVSSAVVALQEASLVYQCCVSVICRVSISIIDPQGSLSLRYRKVWRMIQVFSGMDRVYGKMFAFPNLFPIVLSIQSFVHLFFHLSPSLGLSTHPSSHLSIQIRQVPYLKKVTRLKFMPQIILIICFL